MTSSLKLEAGKKYRARNGQVHTPTLLKPAIVLPNITYKFETKPVYLTESGRAYADDIEDQHDLVEEVLESVPEAYVPTPHLVSAARRPGGGVVLFTDGKIAFEITDAHATHLIARIAQAIVS